MSGKYINSPNIYTCKNSSPFVTFVKKNISYLSNTIIAAPIKTGEVFKSFFAFSLESREKNHKDECTNIYITFKFNSVQTHDMIMFIMDKS